MRDCSYNQIFPTAGNRFVGVFGCLFLNMKKITAISVQKNNPNRVNIYLDGEFAFGVARITAAWLKNGDELSDEKIAKLVNEDAREQAYQQALLFLSYRARSEKEIRQNLRKHEVPEDVIEETLQRLRSAGLANDNEFARAWVENRNTFRPRSKRALTMELRQKGLDDEAIQASVSKVDEEALAYQAAQKRAVRFKDLDWVEFRKKLSEFLARRGFSYSVTAPVVTRIWNETHAETPRQTGSTYYEDEDIL
jgi:regulatory protein